MRHSGAGRAADGLDQAPARALHLRPAGLPSELQRGFHRLVDAAGANGIATRFAAAQGIDRQLAGQAQPAVLGQPPALPARGESGRFQRERGVDRIGVAQLEEIHILALDASLALLDYGLPREHWRTIARGFRKPLLYAYTPQYAPQAKLLKAARPATVLAPFSDAGHALFADQPQRFSAELARFVATLPR